VTDFSGSGSHGLSLIKGC